MQTRYGLCKFFTFFFKVNMSVIWYFVDTMLNKKISLYMEKKSVTFISPWNNLYFLSNSFFMYLTSVITGNLVYILYYLYNIFINKYTYLLGTFILFRFITVYSLHRLYILPYYLLSIYLYLCMYLKHIMQVFNYIEKSFHLLCWKCWNRYFESSRIYFILKSDKQNKVYFLSMSLISPIFKLTNYVLPIPIISCYVLNYVLGCYIESVIACCNLFF